MINAQCALRPCHTLSRYIGIKMSDWMIAALDRRIERRKLIEQKQPELTITIKDLFESRNFT